MKFKKNVHKSLTHPLSTGSIKNNLNLIWNNKGFNVRFSLRVFTILMTNMILLPFRILETKKWNSKIDKIQIRKPPIFILGHWRCGTTYLHNLFSQDTRFGYVSTLQSFCPDICIEGSKILWPIFRKLLPQKRPMDNMLMSLEYPQEEEWAMGNLSHYSFYHGIFFPKKMKSNFTQLIFKNNSQNFINQWKERYLKVLKKATFLMKGKQLIIKNPLCLVRIPILLEMFPNAKFIHIYRNPYIIYYSTVHLFKTLIKQYQLENIENHKIEENILEIYQEMMQIFWDTKHLIPSKNLIEVKFENLENNPVAVLEKIYKKLKLPDFKQAKDNVSKYIRAQSDYKKNSYHMDHATINIISQRWQYIINRFNYALPTYPAPNLSGRYIRKKPV